MYIVKMVDRKYGGWSYQVKGCHFNLGKGVFYRKEELFKSKNEARRHIRQTLHDASCFWRPDVNYSYFEIVQVYPLALNNKYYTTDKGWCRE